MPRANPATNLEPKWLEPHRGMPYTSCQNQQRHTLNGEEWRMQGADAPDSARPIWWRLVVLLACLQGALARVRPGDGTPADPFTDGPTGWPRRYLRRGFRCETAHRECAAGSIIGELDVVQQLRHIMDLDRHPALLALCGHVGQRGQADSGGCMRFAFHCLLAPLFGILADAHGKTRTGEARV